MTTILDPRPVPTSGNDTLLGTAQGDTLSGYSGNDVLNGGAGNDLFLEGVHVWQASAGEFLAGTAYDMGAGHDVFIGGAGQDTLSLAGTTAHSNLDITAGSLDRGFEGDGFTGIETFILGDGYDWAAGDLSGASVFLMGGDDVYEGLSQQSLLDGGTGYDRLDLSYQDADMTIHLDGTLSSRNTRIVGFEEVQGTYSHANSLFGSVADELLSGGSLADLLDGGDGDDTIWGNQGNDTIRGGDGANVLAGGANDDSLTGGRQGDALEGDAGNDTLDGGDGNDTLAGGAGENLIYAGAGADYISLQAVWTDPNDDTVWGGVGADTVVATFGPAILYLAAGNDSVTGAEGRISAWLGDGADFANIRTGTVDGGTGADSLSGTAGVLWGEGGNDVLAAVGPHSAFGPERITMDGGGGNDLLSVAGDCRAVVYGRDGDDRLTASNGLSTLFGGIGNDTYDVSGYTTISDQLGASTLTMRTGGGTANFNTGAEADLIVASLTSEVNRVAHVNAQLAGGNDSMSGDDHRVLIVGTIDGGSGDDSLVGFASGALRGGDGNDTLLGANPDWSGNAGLIAGGAGDDLISFSGVIQIEGGDGNDRITATNSRYTEYEDFATADILGGAGNDTALLGTGNFAIYASDATPSLSSARDVIGVETILFTEGTIRLDDHLGVDLSLGSGNDTVSDFVGANTYRLGAGDDGGYSHVGDSIIFGEGGRDWLEGGRGDTLVGGPGDDILRLASGATGFGGAGTDILETIYQDTGVSDVSLFGGDGADYLHAYYGTGLELRGDAGDDRVDIWGASGSLDLGTGADSLDLTNAYGSTFDVRLGAGADRISGGRSTDIALTVRDFDTAEDRILLRGVHSLSDVDLVTETSAGVTLVERDLSLTLLGVTAAELDDGVFSLL